jgi:hypothetical protein
MTNEQPKILLLDIETSPNLGWTWGKYQQDIIRFNKEWFILCWSVKWLGKPKIITRALPDYSLYGKDPENDMKLMLDLWDLIDEADVVVAHNGDEFDIKKINSRFAFHGITPPSPVKSVDTLKMARKYFGFTSNKLEDLVKSLAIGKDKLETGGFDLWLKCLGGNVEAWKRMIQYNKRDVELLEEVYLKLKPWDITHPNYGVYQGERVCPRCGSDNLHSRGYYRTNTLTYNRFCCNDCGGWSRANTREKRLVKPLISV